MKWWCLALVTLSLGALSGRGVSHYEPVIGDPLQEPWRWRSFSELSGLGAQCMAEDADGRLWFGTNDGVWCYDGWRWKVHPSATTNAGSIVTICAGPAGSVYIGGNWGLSRVQDGQWTRVLPVSGQGFGEIRKIIQGNGDTLWLATSWGLLHLGGGSPVLFTSATGAERARGNRIDPAIRIELMPDEIVNRPRGQGLNRDRHDLAEVALDGRGRLWLGTVGGEILCFDPPGNAGRAGVWMLYNEADGLVCGRRPSVLPLRDGTVWVTYGLGSGHVNVFAEPHWQSRKLAEVGMPDDCSNLLQTRDGTVWLSGRYVIGSWRNDRWRLYQKPEFPIPSAHNFIRQTRDGALWIAGPDTEIQRVDYDTSRWLTLQDLNFQWESETGEQWFLHRDGRVVVRRGTEWSSYDRADGVPTEPVALLGARDGAVWVAGSHEGNAATARFDGRQWTREVHEELAWGIDWRGAFAAGDGSLWFSSAVDSAGPERHRDGLLQYRGGKWLHHHQPGRVPTYAAATAADPVTLLPATQRPEPIGKFLCLGESPDGRIWAGRNILIVHDGRQWTHAPLPTGVRLGIIETLFTSRERELWIGSRQFGAMRFDGREWRSYQGRAGLVANSVRSLAQTTDGSIWAATDHDVGRFDGRRWTQGLLPAELTVPHEGGALKAGRDGRLWINRFPPDWMRRAWRQAPAAAGAMPAEFWTVCHAYQGPPPQTYLTVGSARVQPPGNLSLAWRGESPWRNSEEPRLQFSFRMDDGPWSEFTSELARVFFSLPPGPHRFEVRARDRDFNVDPTPAGLGFVVLQPVWRQGWFVALVALFTGVAAVQSFRLFLERARLQKANRRLAQEVKEHTRAEEERAISEERLRQVVESIQEVFWMTDTVKNQMLYISPGYEKIWGRSCESAYASSLSWADSIVPEDRERVVTAARKKQLSGTYDEEYRILRPDGTIRWIRDRAVPVKEADGIVRRIVGVAEDITEKKKLEEQFLHAQRMEAIGTLASGVAHDLNNILAPMLMAAGLLKHKLSDQRDRAILAMVEQGAQRGASVIGQLLTFSRGIAGERVSVQVRHLLKELLHIMQETFPRNIELSANIPADLWCVVADSTQLHQVFLNLCVNARDAMPGGGRLRIAAENWQLTAVAAPSHSPAKAGPYVRVTVEDTGTGIPPEHIDRIFDPFFTTKAAGKGTGLGLSTVLGIIKSHDGFLTVDSAPGRGTVFRVHLPATTETVAPQADATVPMHLGRGELLLVVDDEAPILESVRQLLEKLNYRVLTASNGEEAIQIISQQRGAVRLVLTDLMMPGMGGVAFIRALRVLCPGLKVIACSGLDQEDMQAELASVEVTQILTKPFMPAQLLQAVDRALAAAHES